MKKHVLSIFGEPGPGDTTSPQGTQSPMYRGTESQPGVGTAGHSLTRAMTDCEVAVMCQYRQPWGVRLLGDCIHVNILVEILKYSVTTTGETG